jgi:hypothetical protein
VLIVVVLLSRKLAFDELEEELDGDDDTACGKRRRGRKRAKCSGSKMMDFVKDLLCMYTTPDLDAVDGLKHPKVADLKGVLSKTPGYIGTALQVQFFSFIYEFWLINGKMPCTYSTFSTM